MKKTYKLNLCGIDCSVYKENPFVLRGLDYAIESILGKAKILPSKRSVEVEFLESIPKYPHTLSAAIATGHHGKKSLIALAIVPRVNLTELDKDIQ